MSRRVVVAACRTYRFQTEHRATCLLLFVAVAGAVAGVVGLVAAALGGDFWPGFGAGVVASCVAATLWELFVLAVVLTLRIRKVPIERFLGSA